MHNFSAVDYSVFISTLCISSGIGIYFGFFGKETTTEEYLLGSRKMKILPIAISLIASQFSGISIMAFPAEIYAYGTQYWLNAPSVVVVVLVINYVFIPVYYNNQISNSYEYLEARFSKLVRTIITTAFLIQFMLALPVIMYIPALAFAQVTGINLHIVNLAVSSVCITYTVLGGIKAVVWTDAFQALIMFISCATMIFIGVNQVGGFGEVWRIADEGNRIEFFNMKLDLTTRQTFWNVSLSYTIMDLATAGLNQSSVQRIVSMPTISKARRGIVLYGIGSFIVLSMNCYMGVIVYANFADCDPLKAGIIAKTDQIVPHFVQQLVNNINGLSGLFMSCVLSAGLSTMSATLNSTSAVLYFDYIRKLNLITHNDINAKRSIKVIVVFLGIYSITMGLVVDKFSHIFQIVMTISGITYGTEFGVFILGMLWPYCNNKGATLGAVASIVTMFIIVMGAQFKTLSGALNYPLLPTSVAGCDVQSNITNFLSPTVSLTKTFEDESFSIFNIAFPWYSFIGGIITISVGIITSYFTRSLEVNKVHPRLFPPIIHSCLPEKIMNNNIELEVIEKLVLEKRDICLIK